MGICEVACPHAALLAIYMFCTSVLKEVFFVDGNMRRNSGQKNTISNTLIQKFGMLKFLVINFCGLRSQFGTQTWMIIIY